MKCSNSAIDLLTTENRFKPTQRTVFGLKVLSFLHFQFKKKNLALISVQPNVLKVRLTILDGNVAVILQCWCSRYGPLKDTKMISWL